MGAEHSRVHTTHGHASNQRDDALIAWKHLAVGFQYSATDVAVWPQCVPLVLWFTEHDAHVLNDRLQKRTRTRFLTRDEFHAWLTNDAGDGSILHTQGLPTVPNTIDIMTPPALLRYTTRNDNQQKSVPASTLVVMDRYVGHIFTTFARPVSGKLFAMEFLGAMVVGSRAIWRLDDKCRVLLSLFQDPANPTTLNEPVYKEADLAHLFLSVMHGVAKLTVGVQRLWNQHGLNLSALSRQLAADGIRFVLAKRMDIQPRQGAKLAVTASELRQYVDATPALHRFLALFSGEELRNPFTFGPTRSLSDGLSLPALYRFSIVEQHRQYEQALEQYVSFDGRQTKRRQSAAMLIQSTWRRRCSYSLLELKRLAQQRQRHASVVRLQHFVRHRHVAKVLERHAEAEVHAFNGGVLIAGQGPCVPVEESRSRPSPLKLVDTFKLLHVKISDIAMSRTCAVALQSDQQTLFSWGRCLPRVYADSVSDANSSLTLTRLTPARLAFRFPTHSKVSRLACGLRHALVVTEDGNVHSWGFNDHGQLGHGSAATLQARTSGQVQYSMYEDERDGREYEYLAQPTMLVYFQGAPQQQAEPIPIQSVVCGDYYSLALSRDGDVFTWGEASEGQLGHGDVHASFQVAFVDRSMLNSAFTYLPEPEPVLALSDVSVVQVACKKNHSVALTADGRVFEWGNWGKRLGDDREHAFAPIEKGSRIIAPLRLRQLSVGDHHTIAEGSSVWLTVPGRSDGLSCDKRVYLACSPSWSCDQDTIAHDYIKQPWSCVLVDCDVDDIESEEASGQTTSSESVEMTVENEDAEPSGNAAALWAKRALPFRLCEPRDVVTYDAKFAHVFHCFRSLPRKFALDKMLMLWFHGHVLNKLVVMPRGKPPGVYLQILLPHGETVGGLEMDDEADPAANLPPMVEFPVVASSSARQKATKWGFATHFFHSVMRERLAILPRRVQKIMPTTFMEPNSITILHFDERSCESTASEDAEGDWDSSDDLSSSRFFTRSATPDGRHVVAWSDLVVESMTQRVLAAQEAGALAVLIVLDLLDADPFELQQPEDSGIYVPVFMTKHSTLATRSPGGVTLTLGDVLERFIASQAFDESEELDQPPTIPPAWMVRCFERVDTLPVRIETALANGAAGVVVIQDAQSIEVDGETRGAPVFLDSPHSQRRSNKLVAMVSHDDGELLRTASRLTATDRAMPFVASDSPCELLVGGATVEICPGGTVYAWGNAQNGRLGLGDPTSENGPLRDGYEALTDSAYRFVDRPTPIVALAGHEMKQLVCGAAHNVAVTTHGRVFTWGKGARGELAAARTTAETIRLAGDQYVPRVLDHLKHDRIVSAAANDAATALLCELLDTDVYLERRREITQMRNAARKSVGL